jgi:hypothetical protein
VLGALALVAVRQEQGEAAGALPLRLTGGDELVDDDLGAVGEVAELRLPDAEHVGVVERVAVVEAEHGGLGEQRVVDAELGLLVGEVLSGGNFRVVSTSLKTAWRWLNVPRSQSWPLRRTGVPSSRSVPKASASPMPQS